MINILKMNFHDDTAIDIGSIAFDRYGENLHLLSTDISKLNSVLTRAVCIGTYNAGTFYFQSGDVTIHKGHLSTMPTVIHGRSGIYEKK